MPSTIESLPVGVGSGDKVGFLMTLLKELLWASLIPVVATLFARERVDSNELLRFFLNLEGGFLLAFTVNPSGSPHNSFRERLSWIFRDSLKYTSPVSYNFVLFYLGLLCFVVSQIIGIFGK